MTRNMVCKLLQSLYGLKQSLHLWYKSLSIFLLPKLGSTWIYVDHSIFVLEAGIKGLVFSVFVDIIKIMVVKESGMIEKVTQKLIAIFSMIDIEPISFFLGLSIDEDQEYKTIKLFQPVYIEKVLSRFHFDKANSINTPMKVFLYLA